MQTQVKQHVDEPAGFTLIELLIVISIILVLISVALPNYLSARTRSQVAATKAHLASCATALEAYQTDFSDYPPCHFICPGREEMVAQDYYALPDRLTSPIAYLTSRPVDPFNLKNTPGSEGGLTIKYRHPGPSFNNDGEPSIEGIYVPRSFPVDDQGEMIFYCDLSPDYPARNSPVQWGLWSVGPEVDRSRNYQTQIYEPVPSRLWYSPTNGVRSSGIIVRLSSQHQSP